MSYGYWDILLFNLSVYSVTNLIFNLCFASIFGPQQSCDTCPLILLHIHAHVYMNTWTHIPISLTDSELCVMLKVTTSINMSKSGCVLSIMLHIFQ